MASDFGELALVVGDFHIPHRAAGIPEKFQRMLVPNKMQREYFLPQFNTSQDLVIYRFKLICSHG
jgi:hypothetical protein